MIATKIWKTILTTIMMNIKLEPRGGENIYGCFDTAIRVANILNMTVEFEFNSVCCMVSPNGQKETFLKAWEKAVISKSQYKFATT